MNWNAIYEISNYIRFQHFLIYFLKRSFVFITLSSVLGRQSLLLICAIGFWYHIFHHPLKHFLDVCNSVYVWILHHQLASWNVSTLDNHRVYLYIINNNYNSKNKSHVTYLKEADKIKNWLLQAHMGCSFQKNSFSNIDIIFPETIRGYIFVFLKQFWSVILRWTTHLGTTRSNIHIPPKKKMFHSAYCPEILY